MLTRYRAGALALAALGLFALAGCAKPSPRASLVSGNTSVSTEAACYVRSGVIASDAITGCLEKDATPITFHTDQPLGVEVDTSVADSGWVIFVNGHLVTLQGDQQTPLILKTTYYRLPANVLIGDATLTVVQTNARIPASNGQISDVLGVWNYRLTANA